MRFFKYWPPYFASGISVKDFDLDIGYVVSQMKRSFWNSNAFGTMYGGSLYSMCDPFYVFLLMHKLGRDYYIWDIESNIKFLKATKDTVTARFDISESQLAEIREKTASGEKYTPVYRTEILWSEGQEIAEVEKTLYVKLKPKKS